MTKICRIQRGKEFDNNVMSFWRLFCLFFVVFHLYLLGDVFFRWDGFSYYGAISEFIRSVALIVALWSLVSAFASIAAWLIIKIIRKVLAFFGLDVKIEDVLIFLCTMTFLILTVWYGKQHIISHGLSFRWKLVILLATVLLSLSFSRIVLNSSASLVDIVVNRITPLVWLFGILFIASTGYIIYFTWFSQNSAKVFQSVRTTRSSNVRPNIILFTFDALTARDMSVYGYDRETTPFIRRWSEAASVFTRAESSSNLTTPAITSIMTGKRLWSHRTFHNRGAAPVRGEAENFALLLRKNGYYTLSFMQNPNASLELLGLSDGFVISPKPSIFREPRNLFQLVEVFLYTHWGDRMRLHDWIIRPTFPFSLLLNQVSRDFSETSVFPEKAYSAFLSFLENGLPEPFFAWIHILPPHSPFLPPDPYKGMFEPSSALRSFKQGFALTKGRAFIKEGSTRGNTNITEIMKARYDEFIRFCDSRFQNFISSLEEKGLNMNTVIILSSDHGESFQHNYIGHGGPHLYEQVTHIPLIVKEPGQTEYRRIDGPVEQIDIPATILEFAKVQRPEWMEGRSFVPLLHGDKLPEKPLFSMNFEKSRSIGHTITGGTVSVWKSDFKLIHYLQTGKGLLFNMKNDPDELADLFSEKPDVAKDLLKLIDINFKKTNK